AVATAAHVSICSGTPLALHLFLRNPKSVGPAERGRKGPRERSTTNLTFTRHCVRGTGRPANGPPRHAPNRRKERNHGTSVALGAVHPGMEPAVPAPGGDGPPVRPLG